MSTTTLSNRVLFRVTYESPAGAGHTVCAGLDAADALARFCRQNPHVNVTSFYDEHGHDYSRLVNPVTVNPD